MLLMIVFVLNQILINFTNANLSAFIYPYLYSAVLFDLLWQGTSVFLGIVIILGGFIGILFHNRFFKANHKGSLTFITILSTACMIEIVERSSLLLDGDLCVLALCSKGHRGAALHLVLAVFIIIGIRVCYSPLYSHHHGVWL